MVDNILVNALQWFRALSLSHSACVWGCGYCGLCRWIAEQPSYNWNEILIMMMEVAFSVLKKKMQCKRKEQSFWLVTKMGKMNYDISSSLIRGILEDPQAYQLLPIVMHDMDFFHLIQTNYLLFTADTEKMVDNFKCSCLIKQLITCSFCRPEGKKG